MSHQWFSLYAVEVKRNHKNKVNVFSGNFSMSRELRFCLGAYDKAPVSTRLDKINRGKQDVMKL